MQLQTSELSCSRLICVLIFSIAGPLLQSHINIAITQFRFSVLSPTASFCLLVFKSMLVLVKTCTWMFLLLKLGHPRNRVTLSMSENAMCLQHHQKTVVTHRLQGRRKTSNLLSSKCLYRFQMFLTQRGD